jgi:CRISPR-associated protein Csx10
MSSEDNFSVIRYAIELQSPVLATDVMGEPNSAVTLPYISGALLRGALIARYLQNGATKIDAGYNKSRGLFFGDQTRFLNAYPFNPNLRNKEKRRALPRPSAWRRNKYDFTDIDDGRQTYDFSRKAFNIHDDSVEGDFFWREEQDAALFSPRRRLNVHTQRDARKGRSTKDSGDIYRYESLAAGLQLQALILTTSDQSEEIVKWLGGTTLWIGRARRAGYGKAVITEVEQPDYWRESGTDDSPAALKAGEELHIAFTSDALLRNKNGQATLDPCGALETALDLPNESLTSLPDRLWAESKIVGGFNRKWGLALPQTVALAAGSVFVYETKVPINWEKLAELERNGIGERRNEGFGCVLVDWMKDKYKDEAFTSYEIKLSSKSELRPLSNEEERQVKIIAKRILRRRLDEDLIKRINSTSIERAPHKAQLSRLRALLRDVQVGGVFGEAEIERLTKYFDSLTERRSSKTQFNLAKVQTGGLKQQLLPWLKDQLGLLVEENEKDQKDQNEQKKTPAQSLVEKWKRTPVRLGEGVVVVSAEVDEKIALEYALRFVDQVLYRTSKDQRNEERK